ncbi:hypothetical protein Tco_1527161 [Tanacetum coccineum]
MGWVVCSDAIVESCDAILIFVVTASPATIEKFLSNVGVVIPWVALLVKGYRSSYKKDHTQASKDLATATFPWLDEFMAVPSAPIKALLLKKPLTIQRPALSRTQVPLVSSQRATSSAVPASNPMSPPADAFVVKP